MYPPVGTGLGSVIFLKKKVCDFLEDWGRWLQSQHDWDMWDIRQSYGNHTGKP